MVPREGVASVAQEAPLYAVLDLGSNRFQYLLGTWEAGTLQVLMRQSVYVGLLTGTEEATQTLATLAEVLQKVKPYKLSIIGTHAFRAGVDSKFLANIEKDLATPVSVLSEHTEACLIYLGIAFEKKGLNCVWDIGGGSTECAWGEGPTIHFAKSVPLGSLALKALFERAPSVDWKQVALYCQTALNPLISALHYPDKTIMLSDGLARAVLEWAMQEGETMLTKAWVMKQCALIANGHFPKVPASFSGFRRAVLPFWLFILQAILVMQDIPAAEVGKASLADGALLALLLPLNHPWRACLHAAPQSS